MKISEMSDNNDRAHFEDSDDRRIDLNLAANILLCSEDTELPLSADSYFISKRSITSRSKIHYIVQLIHLNDFSLHIKAKRANNYYGIRSCSHMKLSILFEKLHRAD